MGILLPELPEFRCVCPGRFMTIYGNALRSPGKRIIGIFFFLCGPLENSADHYKGTKEEKL